MKTLLTSSLLLILNTGFAQFSCGTAIPITSGYTSPIISTPGNTPSPENWITSAAVTGEASVAAFTSPDVYMFQYTTGSTAGESFYFTIECDYAVDGEHSIGVWTGCAGSSLSGCITSTYKFDNVLGVCAKNLNANTTYYIGIGKQWVISADDRKLKFKVIDFTVETSTTIPSDECATAALINVEDPYSGSTRCTYTASAGSPAGCGSIENDSWMRFTAGSSTVVIDYSVTNCTNDYGVQLAVYSGTCGALSLLSGSCVNYATNNSSGTWTFTGLTVNQTYYIRTDGYAGDLCSYSFNPVAGVIILPIELSNFEVEALDNGYNKLSWKTLSENNSAYFSVERSENGYDFTEIAQINAAGNSSSTNYYQFLDRANTNAALYYRIKSFDMNQKYYFSDILSINNNAIFEVSLYPNPSKDGLFFIQTDKLGNMDELEVFDCQGKMIHHETISEKAKAVQLNLSHVKPGFYTLKIKGVSFNLERKIVLQ